MMNPILWPYVAALSLVQGVVSPMAGLMRLLGRDGEELPQRLGRYPRLPGLEAGVRRIWLQAVSVGEVHLAAGLVAELKKTRPEVALVVSTGTRTGQREAKRLLGRFAETIYFPIDSPCCVKRALASLRPDLVVLLETELWPVFLHQAGRQGLKVVLVNGRISDRSIRSYKLLSAGFKPLLGNITLAGAASPKDAERLRALGVPAERVVITGNAKMDALFAQADHRAVDNLARSLGLREKLLWAAGSIRSAEEALVIEAFKKVRTRLPEAILLLAPRHLHRVKPLCQALEKAGLPFQRRLEITRPEDRVAPVVVLDTMGELFGLYKAAGVALVGGSLVPLGGQNPLEPAFWGVPVLFGRHMDDFAEAASALLESGGAREVAGVDELAHAVVELLTDPEKNQSTGRAAQAACQAQRGAAGRAIELITKVLDQKG